MGRSRGRKEKRQYEILSVQQKCLGNRLRHLVHQQFGVCAAEAVSVALLCQDYLQLARPQVRRPFDVVLSVPRGRDLTWKVSPQRVPTGSVLLSPVADDDTEVCALAGVRDMQTARAIRLVEQADRCGCTMPLGLLASLVHQTTRTVTSRLKPLWQRGLHLPVIGITESSRPTLSRLALVLRGELQATSAERARRGLFLSPAAYGKLLRLAMALVQAYVRGHDEADLQQSLNLSPVEVKSTLEVMRVEETTRKGSERLRALLEGEPAPLLVRSKGTSELRSAFVAELIRRHAFSPNRAELLATAVEEAAQEQERAERGVGDIVYWAIGHLEPAGKLLVECELVPTVLPFYVHELDERPRGTMGDLKVSKAQRMTQAAYAQGGLLCLPDLAFLLGMGVSSLQKALFRAKLVLPTRGNVADIGRGVTHRVQIVTLYVQGYTEPQIVARTRHSYESVASYIADFRRVMLLVDQNLPSTHIRKVLRMGLSLVEKYIALYRQLDQPEYQWKLNLMRRAAMEEEKKLRRDP